MSDPWAEFTPAEKTRGDPWAEFTPVKAQERPNGGFAATAADVAKSAAGGLVKGVAGVVGLPDAMGNVLQWAEQKLLGETNDKYAARLAERKKRAVLPDVLPSTEQVQGAIERNVTGPLHEPETTAGKYAQTAAEFVPGSLLGPGGIARNALVYGVGSGLTSEAAGQAAKGTQYEGAARIAGGIASPLAVGAARRAITPLPTAAGRQTATETLANEGVELTAGQRTGSRGLRYLEAESGAPAQTAVERQKEQFTRSLLHRAGEDAPRATPEVIDSAFHRLGTEFDGLAARNDLRGDPRLVNDLVGTWREYSSLVPETLRAPVVNGVLQDVVGALRNQAGVIPGETYQALRSRLDRMARSAARDPQLSDALYGIRTALDNAMERTLAHTNPADLGAWREARRQYRNLIPIAKAVEGGGEDMAAGLLSPAKMRQTTVSSQGGRNYARGQGEFADVVRAGNETMTPLPQSGTAPRLAAQAILSAPGAAVGYEQGGTAGAGVGAVLGALGGRYLGGRALMSRPMQGYLGNQVLPPAQATTLAQLGYGAPSVGIGVVPQLRLQDER